MKKLIVMLCVMAAVCGLVYANGGSESQGTAQKAMVLRYAENQPQDYPTTQAAYEFAKMVEEKTGGRIKVEVYYGF